MRTMFFASLAALLIGSPALAQSNEWGGYYLGADFGQSGGRDGEIEALIDPAREPRLTYIVPPETAAFDRERKVAQATSAGLRIGWLSQVRGIVWGIEGQAVVTDIGDTFTIGPVPVPAGARTNFIPGFGSYNNSRDTLTAGFAVDASAALRLRAGLPLGDRWLVTAFAGPAAASASLNLRQDSQIVVVENVLGPFGFDMRTRVEERTTRGEPQDEVIWGGNVGAAIDMQLGGNWSAHAEAGVSFYNAVEARSGGGGASGGNSQFSYAPVLYSMSLGVARRF